MYRPQRKIRQRGGQYVSSISDYTSWSSIVFSTMGDIAPDVLSSIEGRAGLTAEDQDIATLNAEKLAALIREINNQITADNNLITENMTKIANIGIEIETNPGLRGLFNTANANVGIAERDLERAAKAYSTALLSYDEKQRELAALGVESSFTLSSIRGYQDEYSTILRELPGALEDYTKYSTIYGFELEKYNNYVNNYSTTVRQYESTIEALIYNSSLLSVVTYEYNSTSLIYSTLNGEYNDYITTYISPAQDQLHSTQRYYSSILDRLVINRFNYRETSRSLQFAQIDLEIAIAKKECEAATATEVSTITMFDTAKNNKVIIDAQLLRDPNNMDLIQQKQSADTTFATLSTLAYNATQDRIIKCTNQSTISQTMFQSTLSYYDGEISTAAMYYADAIYRNKQVISTISGMSVNIEMSLMMERQYISTMSSFSSLYGIEQIEYRMYSKQLEYYDMNAENLSTQLTTTLSTLTYYINYSTMYGLSTGIYRSNYMYYSTLESQLRSSIASYESQWTMYRSSIAGIDIEVSGPGGLDSQIKRELQNLNINGPLFYDFKKTEIDNDINEYLYTVQEINATVGMTVGDLVILKMDNIRDIDRNNLRLTLDNGVMTETAQTKARDDIQRLAQQNSVIDSLLVRLNPLEIEFKRLIDKIEEERSLKTGTNGFIDLKKRLFNDELRYYETNGDSTVFNSLISDYNTKFNEMNNKLGYIQSRIGERNEIYKGIREVLKDTTIRDVINGILTGDQRFPDEENDTFVGLDITANSGVFLKETRSSLNISEYSLLPPLPESL